MAVCFQNLPLGALSSRNAHSVLVGALFKKFGLFLNTGVWWKQHFLPTRWWRDNYQNIRRLIPDLLNLDSVLKSAAVPIHGV
jgi:hypothetical protein